MSLAKSLPSKWMSVFADLARSIVPETGAHAVRVLTTLGSPSPTLVIAGTAGNGVTALVDLNALFTDDFGDGIDVGVECGGEVYIKFGVTNAVAVTLANYNAHMFAGQCRSYHLPKNVTYMAAWGVGFAQTVTVTRMNG